MAMSITYGPQGNSITWHFTQDKQVGQYVDGSWWVVGPVVVDSISPATYQQHGQWWSNGSMKNPWVGMGDFVEGNRRLQGFEQRIAYGLGGGNYYDHNLNVADQLPVSLDPGDVLVSSVSIPLDESNVSGYNASSTGPFNVKVRLWFWAPLTVVGSPQPADAFRPPSFCVYTGGDFSSVGTAGTPQRVNFDGTSRANYQFRMNNVNMAMVPRVALGPNAPPASEILNTDVAMWPKLWASHPGNLQGPEGHGAYHNNDSPYGWWSGGVKHSMSVLALAACCDYSDAERYQLVAKLIQLGIDLWANEKYYVESGYTWQGIGSSQYDANITGWGNWHNGRLAKIIIAGHLLASQGGSSAIAMRDVRSQHPTYKFQEMQARWVQSGFPVPANFSNYTSYRYNNTPPNNFFSANWTYGNGWGYNFVNGVPQNVYNGTLNNLDPRWYQNSKVAEYTAFNADNMWPTWNYQIPASTGAPLAVQKDNSGIYRRQSSCTHPLDSLTIRLFGLAAKYDCDAMHAYCARFIANETAFVNATGLSNGNAERYDFMTGSHWSRVSTFRLWARDLWNAYDQNIPELGATTTVTLDSSDSMLATPTFLPGMWTPTVVFADEQELTAASGGLPQGDWYDPAWAKRKPVTIKNTTHHATGIDESDFQIVLHFTDLAMTQALRADLFDFVITADDGTTRLSHEIDRWDRTTGEAWVWVKIPTLKVNVDQVLYFYYSNPNQTVNMEDWIGCWPNHVGVYHLKPNGNPDQAAYRAPLHNSRFDLGWSGAQWSGNGGPVDSEAGLLGGGVDFTPTEDQDASIPPTYVNLGAKNVTGSALTIQAMVRFHSHPGIGDARIFAKTKDAIDLSENNHALMLSTIMATDGQIYTRSRVKTGTDDATGTVTNPPYNNGYPPGMHPLLLNTNYWLSTTYDGAILRNYVDADQEVHTVALTGTVRTNTWPVHIGGIPYNQGAKEMDGVVGEVRVLQGVAKSATRIAAEWAIYSDPDSFIEIGSEESYTQGGTASGSGTAEGVAEAVGNVRLIEHVGETAEGIAEAVGAAVVSDVETASGTAEGVAEAVGNVRLIVHATGVAEATAEAIGAARISSSDSAVVIRRRRRRRAR